MCLYIYLYSLLFIIPGISMALSYAMVLYILDELSVKEKLSKLFKLSLSFIGWIILSIMTFGIGLIWVIPYIYNTMPVFYDEVSHKHESSASIE